MFKLHFTSFSLFLLFSGGVCDGTNEPLPSWITTKPGFQNPTQKDSVGDGVGSIGHKGKGDAGWVVTVNEKEGHGVELDLEKLSVNPDLNDFLLVSPWPISNTGNFKRIKLYTGKFKKPLKPLRIPNTKTFFVLYSVSQETNSSEMVLNYRRYGSPLELFPLPTTDPIKKRETIYEIQLRGKSPEEYKAIGFLKEVKEAIRARAKRYCTTHNITFNEDIPTEKMVVIHTVSCCPFEWPDSRICASLEHSVFVSGIEVPDQELIKDYELVKENLKKMWREGDLEELEALGITVFHLPSTYSTAAYWSLLVALTIICSLIIALILRKVHRTRISQRKESLEYDEIATIKTPKFKLHKHQTVPGFILNEADPTMIRLEGHLQKEMGEYYAATAKQPNSRESSKAPIGNYVASVIFAENKAFDDEEDYTVEFRRKTPQEK